VEALAGAGGDEAGGCEGEVQEAPLAGVHGGEEVGFAGEADLGDGLGGEVLQLAGAFGAEAVGVEGDAWEVFGLEVEGHAGEMLDGVEELTVSVEEERGVGAGKFDHEIGL